MLIQKCFYTLILAILFSSYLFSEVVLKADRMLDIESGKIITFVTLVIEKGLIKEVNPKNPPQKAEVIELGNVTLLPGLIDTHTHLSLMINLDRPWVWDLSMVKNDAGMTALLAQKNANKMLMKGFTTVRDVGSLYIADINLSRMEIKELEYATPRIIPCGYGIGARGGHFDWTKRFAKGILKLGPEQGIVSNTEDIRTAVREQIALGAKFIKIAVTGGVLSEETSLEAHFSLAETKIFVDEAKRHGIKVAAHAHTRKGIENAVKAGVASIEHGSTLDKKLIALMIKNDTYLVPTAYVVDFVYKKRDRLPPVYREKLDFIYNTAKNSHKLAISQKVKIAFGTDAGVFPYEENVKEFAVLVELGMAEIEAIRSATVYAADLLGLLDRGKIKPGMLADLVAVKGNPLENIKLMENVQFVMKNGIVYKNSK